MQKKILISLIASCLLTFGCSEKKPDISQPFSGPVIASAADKNQLQLPNFVNLVKSVGNTVVNIAAETTQTAPNQFSGIDPNDPFFELFKQFIPKQQAQPQIKHSLGSGFIISNDGYILTNAHVVFGAKKITVRTSDKQELDAKLIGLDKKTDIALLKVEAKNLTQAKIGDSNKLEVGEWVAAIGAPFGFDNSVTQGIVSAKGRSLPSDGSYVPFIQTDVPINPGNSGGPLFNLNGEVVAMNSQIYSRSGGYMGLSFSIPIDIAMNVANQIKQYGKVSHGQLGVQVQAVTQQLAQSFGLKKASGGLVALVLPHSGAEEAGIRVGDIVLMADGKEIIDSSALPLIVGSKKPGDKIELLIFRNGANKKISVILTGDDSNSLSKADNNINKSEKAVQLEQFGLSLNDLDNNTRQQLRVNSGVLVTNVQGKALMIGISPGDVILSVNNKPVTKAIEVKAEVANARRAVFLISRNGQQLFVSLNADE